MSLTSAWRDFILLKYGVTSKEREPHRLWAMCGGGVRGGGAEASPGVVATLAPGGFMSLRNVRRKLACIWEREGRLQRKRKGWDEGGERVAWCRRALQKPTELTRDRCLAL